MATSATENEQRSSVDKEEEEIETVEEEEEEADIEMDAGRKQGWGR